LSYDSTINAIKDTVGVVREIATVIVIVILICFPGVVIDEVKSLHDAAEKKGVKLEDFDLGVAKASFDDTSEAVAKLSAASTEIEDLKTEIGKQKGSPANAEVEKRIDQVQTQLSSGVALAKQAQLAQDQVIQEASGFNTGTGTYGVVVATDRMTEHVAGEVKGLRAHSQQNIAIYLRGDLYRTVASFPDKAGADAALTSIHDYRPTAYIVNLSKLCTSPSDSGKKIENVEVTVCQGGGG